VSWAAATDARQFLSKQFVTAQIGSILVFVTLATAVGIKIVVSKFFE